MISYKVKGIILAVIISLASIMMPFSVYADGLIVVNGSDYLLGINVDLYDSSLETYVNQAFITSNNGTSNYSQYTQTNVINQVEVGTYKYTFVFNKSYVGRVVMQYVVPGSQTTRQFTLFVNGTTAEFYSSRDNRYTSTSTFINNWTLSSAQLVEHDDIESLEQIVDLLTDIYADTTDLVGASSDMLTELENISDKLDLSNDYLNLINSLRQWNIYNESIPIISYYLTKQYRYNSEYVNSYYNYPLFYLNSGQNLFEFDSYRDMTFVFYCRPLFSNSTDMQTYFDLINCSVDNIKVLNEINFGNYFLRLYKINIKRIQSGRSYIRTKESSIIMPLYFGYSDNKNISLDFAMQYELTNQMLENIQKIANGTTQSNSAASDLETEASEYSEIADDVIGVEEGLTSNFETEVNKIDLNTGLNVFGGNFMTSATWVRTQFDRLTENNPYGSLVVYGLTLGFALLMLGKVFL